LWLRKDLSSPILKETGLIGLRCQKKNVEKERGAPDIWKESENGTDQDTERIYPIKKVHVVILYKRKQK